MVLVLLFPLGFSAPGWQDRLRPEHHIWNHLQEGQRTVVEGWLEEAPVVFKDKVRYRVRLEQIAYTGSPVTVTGTARITLYQAENRFHIGDRLRFNRIKLKRPRNFKNPGRFDYVHYMRSQGIDVIGGVSKAKYIERLGTVPLGFFTALRGEVRERMLFLFDRYLPEDSAALLKAMLLGEKQYLSEELRQAYIDTGLAHLMAVSGLHIGFVAGACYLVLYPLVFAALWKFRSRWALLGYARKLVALLCIVPVLSYMFLVGAKISALRAGVMILVYLFAVLINREKHLLNALLVAAFLILLWNPEAVVGPSFLLSFSALLTIVLAIGYASPPAKDALDHMGEVPWYRRMFILKVEPKPWFLKATDFFYGTVFISLAAMLGTLPILIYFFNHISIGSLFLNVLLVPLTAVLIPLGLFTSFLAVLWEPVAAVGMPVIGGMLHLYVGLPKFAAALPFMSLYVPTPPAVWPFLYYALLVGLPLWLRFRKSEKGPEPEEGNRWRKAYPWGLGFASVALIVWFIWPRFPLFKNGELSVYLLDVGQGESIYMEFPNGETLLLDGGGYFRNSLDVGKLVVAPFLWNRGLWGLTYVGATHSDNDHISGLESLANLVAIGHFLDRRPALADRRIDQLKSRLIDRDAVPLPLEPGKPWQIGEVRLTLLHPTADFIAQEPPAAHPRIGNDLSMVWKIEYGAFSMLLTGDITEKAERYLVEHEAPLQAEILKAPHHGSRTSSHPDFIRAVGPKDVIVSSGRFNVFHHPHPNIVERYRRAGATLWRTDLQGAIHITTDGTDTRITHHKDL
jgi:competence protein ComEC